MPIKKMLAALVAALPALIATTSAAGADEAQKLYTQSLAATCANCHGTEGHAVKDASIPGLAGLKADYIVEQMKAFKSGERKATIMHQIAKGFSDEQTRHLADYFASLKP